LPAGIGSAWETFSPYHSFILRLPPRALSSVADSIRLDPERLRLSSRIGLRDPQLEHLVRALKSEAEADCPGGRPFADALITALVIRLAHVGAEPKSVPAPDRPHRADWKRVQRVLHYIEENLEGDLSLADIAAAGGLSVSNLKHVFRRATGQPVYQYVIHRRVALAEQLLRSSAMPISEVALAAGFSHHSHLTRHLRRWRGTTPSIIRNRVD
jgi:AraC family transcriptional regulator